MDRFEETKLRIKEGVDIVALVEEYVPLRTRGRYHVGLCPFHQEKTPSFTVYGDSQHFKCYGCGEAGDVFSFLMKRDGLSFRESLEVLADRLGIDIEGIFGRGRGDRKRREDVHGTLAAVREWFAEELLEQGGAAARDYLESRGLTPAIEPFGLGFHPTGGRLQTFAARAKLATGVLEQAGLLGKDGYERFAGRLMFPIEDERGRTVGFGGRVLQADAERAKYVNSPESPFFNKRKLLFGLRQVKNAGDRRLAVMEGYTDVIAAHLAGFTGAVATLGTALTTEHARLLERYATDGAVLLFDGDRAGRLAADRAFRGLVHTRLPVSIALLDEGTDPADLVAALPGRDEEAIAKGREHLRGILDCAEDALTVWFRLIHQRLDLTLDVHVERTATDCGRILAAVADPVRRQALGRRMAQHLGLPESLFLRTVAKARRTRRPRRGADSSKGPAATVPGSTAGAGGGIAVGEGPLDPDAAWASATPRASRPGAPGGLSVEGASGEGPEAAAATPAEVVETGDAGGLPGSESGAAEDARAAADPVAATDLDLLACLLASPELLDAADGVGVTLPSVREILDLFRQAVARGSRSKEQIVGYLFMRCAEQPALAKRLADCLDRAEHIKSPTETLSLLLKDRSAHQSRHQARTLRFRLQQARAKGDRALVDKLTQEYLQQLRSRAVGDD